MGKRYGRNQKRRHIEEVKKLISFPRIRWALLTCTPNEISNWVPKLSTIIIHELREYMKNENT